MRYKTMKYVQLSELTDKIDNETISDWFNEVISNSDISWGADSQNTFIHGDTFLNLLFETCADLGKEFVDDYHRYYSKFRKILQKDVYVKIED